MESKDLDWDEVGSVKQNDANPARYSPVKKVSGTREGYGGGREDRGSVQQVLGWLCTKQVH